ncbi:UNVERIFIED_CONTAM: Sulfate transporter 1.3 [Sesamum radiatum]|uniref:Sulfate transporter 1.3 n=1 Tax=Sesamum radiatum TaxID=300843 RepID=A0AAW2U8N1_SESRA
MSGGRVATETDIDSVASSRRHDENAPYVHKVGMPPKQSLFQEFTYMFKETFFHDDPLRPFKDQPRSQKLLLGIQAVFPILDWGRRYKLHLLKGDLIAGLTIASLCIPQDIGYAKLANLDPQFGLYSSFVPPLIYAIMGSSRDIAIGPVAVVSLLLGSMVQNEIDPKHKTEYQRLMFTATFFAGVTQFLLGFFRLGFLIDFLSHAAVVGFMAGAAITISLQQLKGLLGVKKFTKKTDIVSVMRSVWTNVHHGVNHIERGINPSSVHKIHFTGSYVAIGFRIGAIAGMIGLTEAVAIGRTFAAMKDYHLDGNKEMVALGSMNIIGSMTSCYVATGSFSRSAVNYMAGCNTAVSNIVMSIVVLLTLELITPLFKYTPNAILASIIISAVVGLFDYEAMILIWKIDKFDFVACMGAFFGVVFASVEIGLLIAVAISFAKILLQVTRPRTAVLGKIPRTTVYRNIQQYPEATKVPGVLIVRVDSAIYFSNSNYIRERILRLLADEEEEQKANNRPRIQYLIVEMSPVTDIDTSGIHALEDLYKNLQKRDVQLVLANPGQIVLDKFHTSDFANTVGDDKIFLTVADAVMTLAPKMEP